jgi:hypothetical protein
MRTWEGHDSAFGRPIAAPLEQCAELLGADIATVREVAANVEPYVRADGTRIWSLLQLERQLRPRCSADDGAAISTVDAVRLPIHRLSEGQQESSLDTRSSTKVADGSLQ